MNVLPIVLLIICIGGNPPSPKDAFVKEPQELSDSGSLSYDYQRWINAGLKSMKENRDKEALVFFKTPYKDLKEHLGRVGPVRGPSKEEGNAICLLSAIIGTIEARLGNHGKVYVHRSVLVPPQKGASEWFERAAMFYLRYSQPLVRHEILMQRAEAFSKCTFDFDSRLEGGVPPVWTPAKMIRRYYKEWHNQAIRINLSDGEWKDVMRRWDRICDEVARKTQEHVSDVDEDHKALWRLEVNEIRNFQDSLQKARE